MRKQLPIFFATILLLSACNSGAVTFQPSDLPTSAIRLENVPDAPQPTAFQVTAKVS
jgi:hypothetical protein